MATYVSQATYSSGTAAQQAAWTVDSSIKSPAAVASPAPSPAPSPPPVQSASSPPVPQYTTIAPANVQYTPAPVKPASVSYSSPAPIMSVAPAYTSQPISSPAPTVITQTKSPVMASQAPSNNPASPFYSVASPTVTQTKGPVMASQAPSNNPASPFYVNPSQVVSPAATNTSSAWAQPTQQFAQPDARPTLPTPPAVIAQRNALGLGSLAWQYKGGRTDENGNWVPDVRPSIPATIIPGEKISSRVPISSPYAPDAKWSDDGGKTWYVPGSPDDPAVKHTLTAPERSYEPREVTIDPSTGKVTVPKNATKEQALEATNLAARVAAGKLKYAGGIDGTYNMTSPQTTNYKGTTIIFDKAAHLNPDAIKFELDKLPSNMFSFSNMSAGGRPSLVVVGGNNQADLASGIAGLNQGDAIFVADRQGITPGATEGGTPQMTMFALAHEVGHSLAYSKTKQELETLFDQLNDTEKQRYIRVWGDNYGGNTSSNMKSGLGEEVFATNFGNKYPKDLPMYVVPTKVPANISTRDAVGMVDSVAKEVNLRSSNPNFWYPLGAEPIKPGSQLSVSLPGMNTTTSTITAPKNTSTITTPKNTTAPKSYTPLQTEWWTNPNNPLNFGLGHSTSVPQLISPKATTTQYTSVAPKPYTPAIQTVTGPPANQIGAASFKPSETSPSVKNAEEAWTRSNWNMAGADMAAGKSSGWQQIGSSTGGERLRMKDNFQPGIPVASKVGGGTINIQLPKTGYGNENRQMGIGGAATVKQIGPSPILNQQAMFQNYRPQYQSGTTSNYKMVTPTWNKLTGIQTDQTTQQVSRFQYKGKDITYPTDMNPNAIKAIIDKYPNSTTTSITIEPRTKSTTWAGQYDSYTGAISILRDNEKQNPTSSTVLNTLAHELEHSSQPYYVNMKEGNKNNLYVPPINITKLIDNKDYAIQRTFDSGYQNYPIGLPRAVEQEIDAQSSADAVIRSLSPGAFAYSAEPPSPYVNGRQKISSQANIIMRSDMRIRQEPDSYKLNPRPIPVPSFSIAPAGRMAVGSKVGGGMLSMRFQLTPSPRIGSVPIRYQPRVRAD
jgi:hypothetical protein